MLLPIPLRTATAAARQTYQRLSRLRCSDQVTLKPRLAASCSLGSWWLRPRPAGHTAGTAESSRSITATVKHQSCCSIVVAESLLRDRLPADDHPWSGLNVLMLPCTGLDSRCTRPTTPHSSSLLAQATNFTSSAATSAVRTKRQGQIFSSAKLSSAL